MTQLKTPAGVIKVKPNKDEDYPGIWVEIDGEGLVLIEYNPDIQRIRALVWSPEDPENDPIAMHMLT